MQTTSICRRHSTHSTTVCVFNWYSLNLIDLNTFKTSLVCFHNPLRNVTLNLPLFLHSPNCNLCSCPSIPYSDNTKYIGIHFQNDLSWNKHLPVVCRKLRSVSCLLYNIKVFIHICARRLIVHVLALSVLGHGMTIFAHCPEFWRSKGEWNPKRYSKKCGL